MHDKHTSETGINFVFDLIDSIGSLYISLFILCVWIVVILCVNFCLCIIWNFKYSFLFNNYHLFFKAVATARMRSETAPVSEPMYDYSDDKHVPADACVENWTPTL